MNGLRRAMEGMTALGSLLGEQGAQAVSVVGFIGDQPLDRSGGAQQLRSHHDVVQVAWREHEDARPSFAIGQGVDRGRAPAARTPDGLFKDPPFPPAAERCAFTWELSIAAVPITPVLPVRASNIASQMPCRLHRLNRL
jgi:hypothetical protein